MSLLGRRRTRTDSQPKGKIGNKGSLMSDRKPGKKRPFQICEQEFEIGFPVFKEGNQGNNSSKDQSSTFGFLSATTNSRRSSSSRGREVVDAAIASSKLSSINDEGPFEAAPRLGKRKLKASKKHEKSLTKGSAWFNMAKTEITYDKKNDLEALKLRSAMESGHHYKRNNMNHTPKYFHVGRIVESSADFYSSRIPKKQRKKTLAQEFQAEFDQSFM